MGTYIGHKFKNTKCQQNTLIW